LVEGAGLMRYLSIAAAVLLAAPAVAQAQFPAAPAPAVPAATQAFQEIPQLQSDLMTKAGSDRVFFGTDSHVLGAPARATLAAQARWLIANSGVRALLEGHADDRDTRSHALGLGERRASAVRDYLVALGVPRSRLIVTSWGKERPVVPLPGYPASGVSARVVTVIVR
jgi:peptidoglycan-associated lipoprotein